MFLVKYGCCQWWNLGFYENLEFWKIYAGTLSLLNSKDFTNLTSNKINKGTLGYNLITYIYNPNISRIQWAIFLTEISVRHYNIIHGFLKVHSEI